jgi:Major Facilitator Superfamily
MALLSGPADHPLAPVEEDALFGRDDSVPDANGRTAVDVGWLPTASQRPQSGKFDDVYVEMGAWGTSSQERDGLHRQVDPDDAQPDEVGSVVSSVLTMDGIHDVPGFICVCLVILIGDMSRGVYFASMWPLIQVLGGSQVDLGYTVAAFSFGRVLSNPVLGRASTEYGYTKTLLSSCSILLVGTLLYTQVQSVGKPQFLIVVQTVLGIGSGTLGVTRAFVSDVTAKRTRTTYVSTSMLACLFRHFPTFSHL